MSIALKHATSARDAAELNEENICHLLRDDYHVTDVRYNAAGTELLVNMGNDYLYLFETGNPENHTEMKLPGSYDDVIIDFFLKLLRINTPGVKCV